MATYNTFKELAAHLGVDPDNPTPQGQKLVADWIKNNPEYKPGEFTNKYLEGYEPPPADTPTTNAMAGDPRYAAQTPNAMTGDPRFQPPEDTPQQSAESSNAFNKGLKAVRDGLSNATAGAMTAWTPLAASAFQSSDPSGFAASTRAQAAQYDKNAAENQKILQWNQQRAYDDRLADKIAAAQAAKSRKQAAETVGLEGGAMAAAEATEQVTPDYMAEKNYNKQAMDTAAQNLAEVNRNKLEANAARGDANQAEYNERYMNSKDTYVSNLAQAKNDQNKKEETKPEEKPEEKPAETNETTEEKPDSIVEGADSHGSKAETNQQSNTVADATQQQADVQRLVDVIEKVKGINTALKNGGNPQDYREEYEKLAKEYEELNAKVGDKVQQTLEPFYTDDSIKVGNIASTLGDMKFGG